MPIAHVVRAWWRNILRAALLCWSVALELGGRVFRCYVTLSLAGGQHVTRRASPRDCTCETSQAGPGARMLATQCLHWKFYDGADWRQKCLGQGLAECLV